MCVVRDPTLRCDRLHHHYRHGNCAILCEDLAAEERICYYESVIIVIYILVFVITVHPTLDADVEAAAFANNALKEDDDLEDWASIF